MLTEENRILQKTKGDLMIQLFKYEQNQEKKALDDTDAMIQSRILQDKYDNSLNLHEMLKEQNLDYDEQI